MPTALEKLPAKFWQLSEAEAEKVEDTLLALKNLVRTAARASKKTPEVSKDDADIAQHWIERITPAFVISKIPGPRARHWWTECMGRVAAADRWMASR